ncbi:peptide/nickel transport system permease protein [Sedimentibacter acidaminivorans]|uniref:Peptide/nickel transport system permease protein n=1 Tax=Sedimentibacter acidaminivorans TaxID=913099 RepID=A0ABS4GBF8_9FIRM|nr:ABC transporter permease [Sedimentibacter acidaminivorans]MBP1925028.1 peptide/nickel transport system permease protein [Sedimentibacter acidaminivorans]
MRLLKYITKRILVMLLTLFVLVTILFFLFRVVPGDPVSMFIDSGLDRESQELLLKHYGLDKPIGQQYIIYIKNLLKGDFGNSFQYGKSALEVIAERFCNTMILMVTSLIIAFFIGITAGAALAWKRNTKFDMIGTIIALIVRCAPIFWTGMILLSIFAFKLKILPLGGMNTPGMRFDNLLEKYLNFDFLKHLILPAVTAALYSAATPLLVMRTSMLEVIKEDYIELARAKGLKEKRIMRKHAMRTALLPVVTIFAVQAGFAIGGSVLIETVFRWPGMGREIVLAVSFRDYPLAQTAFLLIGVMTALFNLIADILYAYLDPRVALD